MRKHTHGPWEIAPGLDSPFCVQSFNGYAIAETADWGSIRDKAERKANARLIAAAPDLLEALRLCLAWMPNEATFGRMGFDTKGAKDAIESARSAIQRATVEA